MISGSLDQSAESKGQADTVLSAARMSRDARFDGKFFVAVKTTGIFCRPICPAKLPKEENVVYYTQAAKAMSDGFRPCFRCRPDSAPSSSAWLGVNATVHRGMSLLSAIPVQNIETIASRLGISERYLYKLFTSALGISPKQYQNMHRALFAKQLIQQTCLSMTEVAFSAGYQSLRHLQRAMEQYCAATPSQLRQHQRGQHKTLRLFLSYRPPYNWPYVRAFLATRAIKHMENVSENSYERFFAFNGASGHMRVTHDVKRHGFIAEIVLSDLTYLHQTVENIRSMLDLNADPVLIEQGLLRSGLNKEALTPGIRLPSTWSVFESGCRAILGQQVSVKAAVAHVSLLVEHLSTPSQDEQSVTPQSSTISRAFPTAKAIASSDLHFLRMPLARKAALREFAQLFAEKDVDGLHDWPTHEHMLAIKGVGPWTVDYLKMRGERNPDVYLGGDLIVRKTAEKYPLTPSSAAPWRSYLTLQLWHLSDKSA
ncbi:AlkA N-terminal domain-containing protein [Alteromonas sp. D210916BOD_24]|uniref:DNA-3-methyladenine glycosylase 2 family protein n=1 Tax=Alteromonas sp. D210916BOD_24 TaxID=3157618 RepID=UPI00399CCCFA